MRLIELHPEWHDADPERPWLYFDCPHCKASLDVRIPVQKGNPPGQRVWGWNGERDFDKVTLTPSINYERHWHGFVTNGEVTTV